MKEINATYCKEFFASLKEKRNRGQAVFLILNLIVICCVMTPVVGIIVYALSMLFALSSMGEKQLRRQNRCRALTEEETARLLPLFEEVYARAGGLIPELPADIQMYIVDCEDPNAFATGRKTVCVTTGLMALEDEQISGILAHEFGHLSHKDTDFILAITVGNTLLSVLGWIGSLFVRICIGISTVACRVLAQSSSEANFAMSMFKGVIKLFSWIFRLISWAYGKIGLWLTMSSSRQNEFAADSFAGQLGYAFALADALEAIDGTGSELNGTFAMLAASHPKTSERVERLRSEHVQVALDTQPSLDLVPDMVLAEAE